MNTSMLDILGATIIGGMVMLVIFHLNTYSSMQKMASDYELKLQQNAKTLAEIVNEDLRKVGFNKFTNPKIISAQEKLFSFYGDIDSNSVVDIVTYRLGDSTDAAATDNPSDRPLIRIVNGDSSKGPSLGLTNLKFTYKDTFGNVTAVADSIQFIKVELWLQTTEMIENKYPFTYWEMTINPRNL